jgi:hypothetical protein
VSAWTLNIAEQKSPNVCIPFFRVLPLLLVILIQENTQRVRALIAEAQLEVGPDHEDPMDYNDSTFMNDDNGDQHNEDDGEALDIPLFSQFLATAAQQR